MYCNIVPDIPKQKEKVIRGKIKHLESSYLEDKHIFCNTSEQVVFHKIQFNSFLNIHRPILISLT